MKYNRPSRPEEIRKIGHYPQATYHKKYDPNAKNCHWRIKHKTFPDFKPILDISLHSKSKRTDFLNLHESIKGYIVSKRLKDIFSKFSLPKHEFYSINVYHKEEILEYYWFYYVINEEEFWENIDISKSYGDVVNADNLGVIEKKIPIQSKDQILADSDSYKFPYHCRIGNVVLKSETPKYDFYQIQCLGYHKFFSDRIINCFQKENITGLEFKSTNIFEIED